MRRPLSVHARRKGWVGSNILLKDLPTDAMLYLVKDHMAIDLKNDQKYLVEVCFSGKHRSEEQRMDHKCPSLCEGSEQGGLHPSGSL